MSDYKYIIVDGLVKSGKTGLAQILSKEFDSRLILDNKENPFFEEYLNTLAGAEGSVALKNQLIFLLNRYQQQMEISQKGLFQKTTVSDYIFFRDAVYAHLTLADEDLDIYKKIYSIFSKTIINADIVVYLQISFAEMLKRIQQYGTPEEKNTPAEYWREVFEAYNYYFFNYKVSPLLVVNMEKIDLGNPTDIQHLVKEIREHKKGTKYYAPS